MRQAGLILLLAGSMATCGGRSENPERSGLPPSVSDSAVFLPAMGIRIEAESLDPPRPVRSEGQSHLFYELRLTSFDPRIFRVDSIDVIDSDADVVVARLSSQPLRDAVQAVGAGDPLLLEAGRSSFVFFGFPLGEADYAPSEIQHRLWLSHNDGFPEHVDDLTTAPERIRDRGTLELDPPLQDGLWYAHAGPAVTSHHRRTLVPRSGRLTLDSRFATDWIRLEASEGGGEVALAGPSWDRTWDAPVFSASEGTVVTAFDSLPDDPFGQLGAAGVEINWETIGGNRVVVDAGDGRFVWYEHLRQGSVEVAEGDRVHRGQRIGSIGNSGNSSRPHLHFEVTDSPVLGHGEGLPYHLRCFELAHRVAPAPDWDAIAEGSPSEIGLQLTLPTARRAIRYRELPLGGAVVVFPRDCPDSSGASDRVGTDS